MRALLVLLVSFIFGHCIELYIYKLTGVSFQPSCLLNNQQVIIPRTKIGWPPNAVSCELLCRRERTVENIITIWYGYEPIVTNIWCPGLHPGLHTDLSCSGMPFLNCCLSSLRLHNNINRWWSSDTWTRHKGMVTEGSDVVRGLEAGFWNAARRLSQHGTATTL